ncbi:MAG: SDR family oxidoreductase [Oligoflexus sp.]
MKRKLKDSVVVITGASSGIGRAAAMDFARRGASLVLASRSQEQLDALASDCRRFGAEVLALATDVSQIEEVEHLAKKAIEEFEHIDVWVNNAGVTLFGRIDEVPYKDYRKVIETNLLGYIHGARAVIPHFREQGHGVLINNSSMIGKVGSPYLSAYVVSKFGIVGLSESLRQELRDSPGIKVCTVLPASIDTPLFQHAANYTGRSIKPLSPIYDADMVAQEIVRLSRHPEREVYVGESGLMMGIMRQLLPGIAEKMIARQVEKDHFTDSPAENSSGNLYEPKPQWSGSSGQWRELESKRHFGQTLAVALPWLAVGVAAWMFYKRKELSLPDLRKEAQDLRHTAQDLWDKGSPRLKLISQEAQERLSETASKSWSKAKPRLKHLSEDMIASSQNLRKTVARR